ncbi:MAG: HAD family hydrolase [Pseudomonadota bacterium]
MTETRIRGLLFDKDGTLLDFQATWAQVADDTLDRLTPDRGLQIRLAEAVGYDAERRQFAAGSPIVAGATEEIASIWQRMLPGTSTMRLIEILVEGGDMATEQGALTPAVPDLSGFLDGLRGAGYRLGIATHDTEAAARAQMRVLDAHDQFDFICGYDSGHGLKPGPGMLTEFSVRTGLAPYEIAMVGDSVHDLGVAASAKAGMAIGVLTGPATETDLAPYADHILHSIGGLPALLHEVNAAR